MQKIITLTIVLLLAMTMSAADITSISTAFKSGKAADLASMFDTEVDMALPGATSKCNPKAAVDMLSNFFAAGKPTNFAVVHNADKKDSGFIVGKLTTAKGEFRVNISYRSEGNRAIIQSVRIE
ncbi:MAG: DUF4783 domain-containing protein [Tannerellaceae bacterium]|nr:DUF4783 domain-containing protein [Tannerellaceae bacterium]